MIFGNVNFDLMYALPHQTVAGACADVAAALKFAPPHLSFYHLTLEPNTLFIAIRRRCPTKTRLRTSRMPCTPRSIVPATALRNVGLREAGPRLQAQSELLAIRRLSRHRRWRAFETFVLGPHRAPACAGSSPGSIWSTSRKCSRC
jgi:hypothetical protein